MELWSETLREFHTLLERHGAFRAVRTLFYEVSGGTVALTSVTGQSVKTNSVIDPDGRRLCLFLTNGDSSDWGGLPLQGFVRSLGRAMVVAIMQMLPQRLWSQTELGVATETVYNVHRASPNATLMRIDPLFHQEEAAHEGSCVPLITLQPGVLKDWAKFVMEPRRVEQPSILLEHAWNFGSPVPSAVKTAPPGERLTRFHESASPSAFQLLRALAYVPLTLPVMKLVRQSLNLESDESHLAEILLSGLIERRTPRNTTLSRDQVLYDFIPGVQDLLLQTLSNREIEELDAVMQPARERLRQYVERKLNTPMRDFTALIADSNGLERLPPEARPFLEITRRIYEMRGIFGSGSGSSDIEEQDADEPEDVPFLDVEPRVLVSDAPVSKVVVSGDGKYVVSLQNGWVQVWETATGARARDLQIGPDTIAHILTPPRTDTIILACRRTDGDGGISVTVLTEEFGSTRFRNVDNINNVGNKIPFISPDKEWIGLAEDEMFRWINIRNEFGSGSELPKPGKAPRMACAAGNYILEETEHGILRVWETK